MPLLLTVIEGPAKGREFRVAEAGAFFVGRSPLASFSLRGEDADLKISKRHALFETNSPLCRVYNISEKNAMLVNDVPVPRADLKIGDRVTLGKTTLEVQLTPPVDAVDVNMDEATLLLQPERPTADPPPPRSNCPICGKANYHSDSALCESCELSAKEIRQPLNHYRLVRQLAADGLGRSYAALDTTFRKAVFVRTIQPGGILPTQTCLHMLKQLRGIQKMRHRHLVKMEEVGLNNGLFFIVTRLIRGHDLVQLVKKAQQLKVKVAVGIACQMLSALRFLHKQGIVHGNLQPTNVLLKNSAEGRSVKLTDVHLDLLHARLQIGGAKLPSDEKTKLVFQAPEVIVDSANASPLSDQYSVAALLYYMLTGHRIYKPARERKDQILQKLQDEPIPIREHCPELSPRLISAIHCALTRDPRRRYADNSQFRAALKTFLH